MKLAGILANISTHLRMWIEMVKAVKQRCDHGNWPKFILQGCLISGSNRKPYKNSYVTQSGTLNLENNSDHCLYLQVLCASFQCRNKKKILGTIIIIRGIVDPFWLFCGEGSSIICQNIVSPQKLLNLICHTFMLCMVSPGIPRPNNTLSKFEPVTKKEFDLPYLTKFS